MEVGEAVPITVAAAEMFGKKPCPVCLANTAEAFYPFEDLNAEEIASVRLQWSARGAPLELEGREEIAELVGILKETALRATGDAHIGKVQLTATLYAGDSKIRVSFGDAGLSKAGAYCARMGSVELEVGLEDHERLWRSADAWSERINPAGAWADVREDTVTPDGATFDLRCEEQTGCGYDFALERREGGAWRELPIVATGNYAFPGSALVLYPDQLREHKVSWNYIYGSLAPGEYRIVIDRERGFYGEFTVKQEG